ncbi:MAG: hypothetical protein ACRDCG_01575 [Mycoplasmoidaceae bacterium]
MKNNSDDSKIHISEYIVFRNNHTLESLKKKEAIICAFKNELDFYFKDKINISDSDYIKFINGKFKTDWQSLFSHRGSANQNNEKFKWIIKKYEEEFDLEKRHKLCDDIFDAIVFFLYKWNTQ